MNEPIIHPLITKSHDKLRATIREFAENEIKPVIKELDENSRFSADLTRKMGRIGLFGICLPEEYGGTNRDTLSYIVAVEELARVDGAQAATVAAHNSLGIAPIFNYGTPEQKALFLPPLTSGDHLWAFGLTEAKAGSDSRGTETSAIQKDNHWEINGSKIFITNSASELAAGSTLQVVTGESEGKKELSVILVDRATPGYQAIPIKNKMVWRSADTGRLRFDNCKVPLENLLGERGQGSHIMLDTLDAGRLSIAAMGLGLAQGAFELAKNYSLHRKQFGKPISQFQAIAFKLAEMEMKIQVARSFLYQCCWLKDTGKSYGKEAAIAKLYTSEIAKEVADECVQIHGAYGLFNDHAAERFYRDQRILQIGEGTSEILKLVISKKIGL